VAIEPVTELGTGGALRLPRARVMPLSAPPATYTAAVERYRGLSNNGTASGDSGLKTAGLRGWTCNGTVSYG
jgi:integrase/recombinase XerD